MITVTQPQLEKIFAYAKQANPAECCGLVGGSDSRVTSIYPLNNVAPDPNVSYEAAPEDLFAAQRQMRERSEELLAIYHSHPRQADPTPSETDVRLAYYPNAIYLIIGLAGAEPRIGAFRLSAEKGSWETVDLQILTANQSRT